MCAIAKITPSESAQSSVLLLCPPLASAEHLPAIAVLLRAARLPCYTAACLQYLVALIKLLSQILCSWGLTPSSVIHGPHCRALHSQSVQRGSVQQLFWG